jgi:hypothetical protein
MADATNFSGAADGRPAPEREVLLPRYNEVTVEQAIKRLRRLPPDKLRRVRAYERAHQNRGTVLAAIDLLLEAEPR